MNERKPYEAPQLTRVHHCGRCGFNVDMGASTVARPENCPNCGASWTEPRTPIVYQRCACGCQRDAFLDPQLTIPNPMAPSRRGVVHLEKYPLARWDRAMSKEVRLHACRDCGSIYAWIEPS